ncbi:conserved hypothetical protein [Planktothrix serta PCC 8927]|uniref:Uncharacterized protein n=1 Tax=Planktothrix serta PCC 8927 TaxID=671068 RepID=A0A7Z9E429_9CYAN|nr:hypothetical protein [Planktothrix serta]VXD23866.1 conserved hypothetical protein [Planktothrix serta PCC 8927]
MKNPSKILNQLKILKALYSQENQNELIERYLDEIITHEINIAQQQIAEIETDLKQFEYQYQMSSKDFYRRFKRGELGDDIDFVEWSAFYQMWCSAQKRLKLIQP